MRELSYTGLRHADDRRQVIVTREKYIYIYIYRHECLSLSHVYIYIYVYV